MGAYLNCNVGMACDANRMLRLPLFVAPMYFVLRKQRKFKKYFPCGMHLKRKRKAVLGTGGKFADRLEIDAMRLWKNPAGALGAPSSRKRGNRKRKRAALRYICETLQKPTQRSVQAIAILAMPPASRHALTGKVRQSCGLGVSLSLIGAPCARRCFARHAGRAVLARQSASAPAARRPAHLRSRPPYCAHRFAPAVAAARRPAPAFRPAYSGYAHETIRSAAHAWHCQPTRPRSRATAKHPLPRPAPSCRNRRSAIADIRDAYRTPAATRARKTAA